MRSPLRLGKRFCFTENLNKAKIIIIFIRKEKSESTLCLIKMKGSTVEKSEKSHSTENTQMGDLCKNI